MGDEITADGQSSSFVVKFGDERFRTILKMRKVEEETNIFIDHFHHHYRLIELTLGTLSASQIPSAIKRSRISQANIVGA